MADTQIRFSVQGAEDVRRVMRDLLTDSSSLASSLETSNKTFVASLHEQISLLKKRNKLFMPNQQVNGLPTNPAQQPSAVPFVGKDLVDKLSQFIELLQKEGLTLSEKSLEVLDQRRKNPEEEDGRRPKEKPSDPRDSFLQRFAFSTLMRGVEMRNPIDFALGTTQNLGTSMMMAGGRGTIPGMIVSVLSGLLLARYGAFKEIAPEVTNASRTLGLDFTSVANSAVKNPYARYGVMAQDYLQAQSRVSQSFGGYSNANIDQYIKFSSGYNIPKEQLLELIRTGRGQSNFNVGSTVNTMLGSLKGVGLSEQEASIKIPEYLKMLVELSQRQIETLGKTDQNQNIQTVATLTKIFKNPDVVKGLMGGLDEGLKTSSTDQVEALQLQVLNKMNPGASLWELEKMKERGAMQSGYLPNMVKALYEMSLGNEEDAARNMSLVFFEGGKKDISEQLMKAFVAAETSGRSFTDVDVKKVMDVDQRAAITTNPIDSIEAELQKAKLPDNLESMVNTLKSISESMNTLNEEGLVAAISKALFNADKPDRMVGKTAFQITGSIGVGVAASLLHKLTK